MTTAAFKPSRTAALAYFNDEIRIYADATWEPKTGVMRGWQVDASAVIHAEGTGDARITTSWGRSKTSKVISPTGKAYDVRALATGGSA